MGMLGDVTVDRAELGSVGASTQLEACFLHRAGRQRCGLQVFHQRHRPTHSWVTLYLLGC